MTMATIDALLDETARVLTRLQRGYEAAWRACAPQQQATAELALFLSQREQRSVAILEAYRAEHDEAVLAVHIRFGLGFPMQADDLKLPDHASLDELIAFAERTDELLGTLTERIRLYAAQGRLVEMLESFDVHVDARRRELAAALAELEDYLPSGGRQP